MPISVDWSVSPFLITCPQSELTLQSGTQYQITVEYLWQLLRDFSDSEEAIPQPILYTNTTPTSSTPRIIEVNADYYEFQFEDGAYSVEIINGNSNIRDVEVKNTVSVGTNNTTGFVDPTFLESGLFEGHVTINVTTGVSGTGNTASGSPIGTRLSPSNNIPDATAIAVSRGIGTLYIQGNYTLDTGDDVSGYKIIGSNVARTTLTVNSGADTLNAEISEVNLTGTLDGNTIVRDSRITDITYFSGFLYECEINGTITLGGATQASILGCYSGTPGTGTPTIDMGGSGQTLSLRKYSGGIKLTNKTGSDAVSIDLIGGQVKLDLTTVTSGQVVVRGSGKVIDASNDDWLPHGNYGSLELVNETSYGILTQEMWTLQGLDPDVPMTVTPSSRAAGGLTQTISGDGTTTSTVTRT